MNNLPNNIKFLRKSIGITQGGIALHLNKASNTISNWEKGNNMPNLDELVALSKIFEVDLDTLVNIDLTVVNLSEIEAYKKNRQNVNLNVNLPVNLNAQIVNNSDNSNELNKRGNTMPIVVTMDSNERDNVVMVPTKARAGYLNGFGDPDFISHLPVYNLPGLKNGMFRMFEIEGSSMYPTLNSGDIAITRNVEQLRDIRDDRVHVIVTRSEGLVIKRVLNRLDKDGKLILKSDNYKERELYPTMVIDPEDVIEIWYCTGYISCQMRSPVEAFKKMIDIEARLSLLEHNLISNPYKDNPPTK